MLNPIMGINVSGVDNQIDSGNSRKKAKIIHHGEVKQQVVSMLLEMKEGNMGVIKILAKTYGNYFFTVQGLKVMQTMKKDDNIVVGLGKLFLAEKLMDTAQWLMKPEDKE